VSNGELPKPMKEDAAYTAVKVALGSVPYVGGVLAEAFAATVPSPISKKQEEWWLDLRNRVQALEKAGVDMKKLAADQAFIGVVAVASKMVAGSAQQEKLDALKNAVLNSAGGINIDEDEKRIFLQLVDQLTISQLKMLEFLDGPRAYAQAHNVRFGNYMYAGVDAILEEAFPEWKGKREVYDLVLHDLQTRGLVAGNVDSIHVTMSATDQGMFASRTTDRGKRFLKFIRAQS
jgi:hypothetical protein